MPTDTAHLTSGAFSDARVRHLVGALVFLFIVAIVLQLHGSSVAVWRIALNDPESPSGVLLSSAKAIRTDEWLAWTPSLLSQVSHGFPLENANIGAGKSPMLLNLPVRHFAMLFRPQLYGFFIFNVETAFAFYWSVKLFGLFLCFFLLFHKLTQNDFWIAMFGASWVCFSAYIQWWFSCPPMMPEMLASWAVEILCVIYLFADQKLITRLATLLVFVIAGVNFALCFYPPFQVPLVYLGVAVLTGWFWQNKKSDLWWRSKLFALGLGVVCIAAVVTPYLCDCMPTLQVVEQTEYPGARRSHGGELNVTDTFNGVLGFFNTSERQYLGTRGNSCEASNFYPLWLLALAGGGFGLWRKRCAHSVELMLLLCLALCTFYTFCPVPEWLARVTLFNYVTGTRALLSVGIAGIMLTTMLMAHSFRPQAISRRAILALAAVASIIGFGAASYAGNEQYLTSGRCALLLGLNALFVALYLFAPRNVFAGAFAFALLVNNVGVNPIATGLGPLLEATPAPAIRQITKADPDAKWIVYGNAVVAQFFKAQGVDVLNGLQIVPDLAFYRQLDPAKRFDEIYNRYSFMNLTMGEGKRAFRTLSIVVFDLDISPLDPVLLARGVRYAVFPRRVPSARESGMHLIASLPQNEIWIYRLPGLEALPPAR